jgi:hypothetical protein
MNKLERSQLVWLLQDLANDSKVLGEHYFNTDFDYDAERCFDRMRRARAAAERLSPSAQEKNDD